MNVKKTHLRGVTGGTNSGTVERGVASPTPPSRGGGRGAGGRAAQEEVFEQVGGGHPAERHGGRYEEPGKHLGAIRFFLLNRSLNITLNIFFIK